MLKEMRMEMKLHINAMSEGVHDRLLQAMISEEAKGKTKVSDNASDDSAYSSGDSEIEALSGEAERLIIQEKRKRGADEPVGDSPLVTTPAKISAKRVGMDPKKLMLSCRHPPMKKQSPRKWTPATASLTRRRKIPASPGATGKLKYVQDNLRELGALNIEELRMICCGENVNCEGKKMDIILAITEKCAHTAYGTDEDEGAKKMWKPWTMIINRPTSQRTIKRKTREQTATTGGFAERW
ncbi:hypothetical protein CBR_g28732 [Chara braunii]|uniref:Uncharacterized protein n=1 Tax=Chara braunii TaxID=69332 RepID=A0A388L9N3_CHABU|nr:hypothetical protein CBR_g28732 [Chara braunii]|eukprot:GBG79019.1 hypothetical protein CBR_g28732 [Chara braunii]